MNELEVTWERTLMVSWSLGWRLVLCGILVSIAVAIIANVTGLISASVTGESPIVILIISVVIWALAGIWAVKWFLGKRFSNFRIALVSLEKNVE